MTHSAAADPSSTTPEQGYDLGEIQSPRAVAMGGAQNATGTSTTALYLNPANMALARVYHFEAIGSISPDARRAGFAGGVIDSSTSRLAGGFGGQFSQVDPDGARRAWTDMRLALALPLGDAIAVGVTGRYLRVSQSVAAGPFGASYASDGTRDDPVFNHLTFDAGVTVTPSSGFNIGLVGHNLTNPGTSLAPTTLAGGLGFSRGMFALEGDALVDFTTWGKARGRAMLGSEIFLANHFPVRAGYRYDDGQKAHAVSLGTGYVDKKWSFELSGRRDVVADHPMTLIVAGLRYFYESGSGSLTDSEIGMDQQY
jgi:hypothetical protein